MTQGSRDYGFDHSSESIAYYCDIYQYSMVTKIFLLVSFIRILITRI